MKKSTLMGILLVPAIVGGLLATNRYVWAEDEETQPAATVTNIAIAEPSDSEEGVSTNSPPPAQTVLQSTLPEDVDPNSPFAQLVRMVQAGVDQGVMIAYIKKSPRFFELDADDIIYLTDLGTPPEVIEAAIARDQELLDEGIGAGTPEPAPADEAVEEAPPEVTVQEFYDTLSPYGTWVYVEGYGRCWRPTVVIYDTDWRPYCDNGRWVYTSNGWYWMSNYSWGWTTFHYGRWFQDSRYGWIWWPDTVWAPSWVYWRYNTSYCGWAPLPPHTVYRSGVGLFYRGSAVSVGFNFNLGISSFTFVSTRNFCDPNPRRHVVDRRNVRRIYDRTRGDCRYDLDPHRRTIVNHGIPADHIRTATQRNLMPVSIGYSRQRTDRRNASERLDRTHNRVVIDRPHSRRSSQTTRNDTARVTPPNGSSAGPNSHGPDTVRTPRRAANPGTSGNPQNRQDNRTWHQTPPKRTPQPGNQGNYTGQGVSTPPNHSNNNRGNSGTVRPERRTAPPSGNERSVTKPTPATPTQPSAPRVTTPQNRSKPTPAVPQRNHSPRTTSPNRSMGNAPPSNSRQSTTPRRQSTSPQRSTPPKQSAPRRQSTPPKQSSSQRRSTPPKQSTPPARVTPPKNNNQTPPKKAVRSPKARPATPSATRSQRMQSNKSDDDK